MKDERRTSQEAARLTPPLGAPARRRDKFTRQRNTQLPRLVGRFDLVRNILSDGAPFACPDEIHVLALPYSGDPLFLEEKCQDGSSAFGRASLDYLMAASRYQR